MTITVRLFATFREFSPKEAGNARFEVEVDEHESVQGLLTMLSLPEDLPRIVLVNGRQATEDSSLSAGDMVSIFPPLIGGQ
jgi:molybdopterin converting factor small subunit